MKRRLISLVCTLAIMVTVLGVNSPVYALSTNEEIMEKLDLTVQVLLRIQQTYGGTRTNYKKDAIEALQNIINNNQGATGTTGIIVNKAEESIQEIATYHDTERYANSKEILTLAMKLGALISQYGNKDVIYSKKGRFIQSYDMINSRVSDITFPGTHNSYANDKDATGGGFDTAHENQKLSLKQQLDKGVRWFDMDLGMKDGLGSAGLPVYFAHNNGTGGGWIKMADVLNTIKEYAKNNPEQVIIFEMADVGKMAVVDNVGYAYGKLREAMYSTGFNEYVYNMRPKSEKQDNASDVFVNADTINPKLKNMIASGKNILFVPHEKYSKKDRTFFKELHGSGAIRADYQATKIEERSTLTAVWDPNIDGMSTIPKRFMSLELDPDDGAAAGSQFFASRNNDGRRLYQLAKWYEDRMPDNKHINYFKIDYFSATQIGGNAEEPAFYDMVEAVNTLNKDRFNFNINKDYLVEILPKDIIRNSPAVMSDVNTVVNNAKNHTLERSEYDHTKGAVWSNNRRRQKQGSTTLQWWCLPEFAFDSDLSTVWATDGTGELRFNLGARKTFDKIGIAFEYNQAVPGFKIYASNDNRNWDLLHTATKTKNANSAVYWARTGRLSYQYFKIQTTDVDNEARTGIAEIYMY